MTFPTGTQIPTANVDSPDDDPSLAREDIYDLIVAFNQLVASANAASGVCVLDGSGKVASTRLPTTWSTTGNIQIQPSTGLVNIRNVLRLYQIYADDLGTTSGTETPSAGDLCYLVDGDAGQPCLGCYDGTKWRVVRLATEVGTAGADLSSEFTLAAEADA